MFLVGERWDGIRVIFIVMGLGEAEEGFHSWWCIGAEGYTMQRSCQGVPHIVYGGSVQSVHVLIFFIKEASKETSLEIQNLSIALAIL